MRLLRLVLALIGASAIAATVAWNVPCIRQRLADPVTRAFVFVFVELHATKGVWREGASAPTPKMEAQSAVLDGKLYVFGGFAGTYYGAPVERTVAVYDPTTDAWSRARDLPLDVTHVNAVLDGRNVWLAGGFRGAHLGPPVDNVLIYDVDADRWRDGPPLPVPIAAGSLARIGRRLHYFGGFTDRDTTVDFHWVLDLDGDRRWTPLAPLPSPRGHHASAVVGDRIVAIGGQLRHDTDPVDLVVVDIYDPASDRWSPAASLPTPRSHTEASTFVHNGRIVVVGGRDYSQRYPMRRAGLANVTVYDPALDRWTELPTLPIGLESTCARVIGDTLIVTNGSTMGSIRGQRRTFLARYP